VVGCWGAALWTRAIGAVAKPAGQPPPPPPRQCNAADLLPKGAGGALPRARAVVQIARSKRPHAHIVCSPLGHGLARSAFGWAWPERRSQHRQTQPVCVAGTVGVL
jgi:hypothetical protein